jgi:hypothetical protein
LAQLVPLLIKDTIKSMCKSLIGTGNIDHRYTLLSKALFNQHYIHLASLEMKGKVAKEALVKLTETAVTTAYASDLTGTVDWSKLHDDLLANVGGTV